MNKKLLAVFCILTFIFLTFADVKSATGTYGGSAGINRNISERNLSETQSLIVNSVQNGLLPLFSESIFTNKEGNKILKDLGLEEMPEFYAGHNYELPPIKNNTQKLLQKRIDDFIRLEFMRRDFQNKLQGKSSEEMLKTKPSKEYEIESRKIQQSLKKTDTEIFKSIKNDTESSVQNITEFIVKRCNKGNISGVSHIVNNLKETVANKNNSEHHGKNSLSPGGRSDFFSPENTQNIINTLNKVSKVIQYITMFLEEDDTAKKFYIIFLMINEMFLEGSNNAPKISSSFSAGSTNTDNSYTATVTGSNAADSNNTAGSNEDNGTGAYSGNLSTQIDFTRIIENGEFTDTTTMTASAIQQFFESKNSGLKNTYRGQKPSDIISNVCRQYGINPKVILATAQKEQSLISRTTISQSKLDWAMGVGCPDNGYHNPAYKGLENQLASAIRIFKRWYDDGISKNVTQNGARKRVNYGTEWINCKNEATYSLYMYTPHTVDIHLSRRGGGNYLFCQIYNGFFGGFQK
ncbi:MAG: hypothetical protein M0R46_08950 [Candidatus Muirbacterium halophilum]|nr:hypothetical protein [Candidatus Muirbacterium halophilum]MCK9476033.1 hypothetical protein [Candidatus Muirbacterium halophilum]